MSKNAMAGAVTLCGVGLCMIGGALMMQGGQQAHAVAMNTMPAAASALASTATAQAGGEPTVVWYSTSELGQSISPQGFFCGLLYRAWSDGRVEALPFRRRHTGYNGNPIDTWCGGEGFCVASWSTLTTPTQGYRAAADINADEMVDGADLAMMLGSWGDAPRVPFPPSDCPLNLINP